MEVICHVPLSTKFRAIYIYLYVLLHNDEQSMGYITKDKNQTDTNNNFEWHCHRLVLWIRYPKIMNYAFMIFMIC